MMVIHNIDVYSFCTHSRDLSSLLSYFSCVPLSGVFMDYLIQEFNDRECHGCTLTVKPFKQINCKTGLYK